MRERPLASMAANTVPHSTSTLMAIMACWSPKVLETFSTWTRSGALMPRDHASRGRKRLLF
jgi:hypothetical protein